MKLISRTIRTYQSYWVWLCIYENANGELHYVESEATSYG